MVEHMFLCIFHGLLKLNPSDFYNFSCLFIWLLIAFTSFINNIHKAGFLEYPNRYPNWVPKLVPSVLNWPWGYFVKKFCTIHRKVSCWSLFLNKVVSSRLENLSKRDRIGPPDKKVFWKYAANLQDKTYAEVWFQ